MPKFGSAAFDTHVTLKMLLLLPNGCTAIARIVRSWKISSAISSFEVQIIIRSTAIQVLTNRIESYSTHFSFRGHCFVLSSVWFVYQYNHVQGHANRTVVQNLGFGSNLSGGLQRHPRSITCKCGKNLGRDSFPFVRG